MTGLSDLQWEHLSNYAIATAGVFYFLALLAHLVEWSALRTVPVQAARDDGPSERGLDRPMPARPAPRPRRALGRRTPADRRTTRRTGSRCSAGWRCLITYLAVAAHFVGLVGRGLAADPNRVPWGNMYEFTITGSFVVAFGYLLLRRRFGLDWMGPIVTALELVLLMVAVLWLYDPIAPLTEALLSPWLVIHVLSAIVATGAFTLGRDHLGALPGQGTRREARDAVGPRVRRAAAQPRHARPGVLPDQRVRVPGVDLRGADQRADLGAPGLVVVLELGPQGGVRLHHLGDLRRLPARPRDRRLARSQRRPSWRWWGSPACGSTSSGSTTSRPPASTPTPTAHPRPSCGCAERALVGVGHGFIM